MTEDPMLSGIARFDSDDYDLELDEKPDGAYVLYSHLPGLIAKVREDERVRAVGSNAQRMLIEHGEDCRRIGYAAALRDVVEALDALSLIIVDARFDPDDEPDCREAVELSDVITSIEALGGER